MKLRIYSKNHAINVNFHQKSKVWLVFYEYRNLAHIWWSWSAETLLSKYFLAHTMRTSVISAAYLPVRRIFILLPEELGNVDHSSSGYDELISSSLLPFWTQRGSQPHQASPLIITLHSAQTANPLCRNHTQSHWYLDRSSSPLWTSSVLNHCRNSIIELGMAEKHRCLQGRAWTCFRLVLWVVPER